MSNTGSAGSAGWHPDPGGKHQMRYFDGTTWTEHVADNGVTTADPLEAPAAPPKNDPLQHAGETVSEAAEAVAGAAKRAWAAIQKQPGGNEETREETRADLATLQDLRARGILTDAEFEAAKARIPGAG